jgi:DNA-binding NarL/FixJ family response regulator
MTGDTMENTRVLLCDDHRMFREGARRILSDEEDILVVGDVSSIGEVVPLAVELKPDVVVLDISLGEGPSGLDGIDLIRDSFPEGRILMVSMHQESSFVRAAFARGASGYVTKDAAADDLAAAVRVVSLGGQYLPNFVSDQKLITTHLTVRERDVLELLAAGHTSSEISKVLCLSTRTVETYRSQLLHKLNASSRADLIRAAKVQGIL